MNLFLNPYFWLSILGAGLFLRLIVAEKNRVWCLALINCILIAEFVGWTPAVFVLTFSFILFLCLRYLDRVSNLRWYIPLCLFILFIFYKLDRNPNESSAVASFFKAIPYSYVFLRSIDAFNYLKIRKDKISIQTLPYLASYLLPINMFYAGPIASYKKSCESFSEQDACQTFSGTFDTVNVIATGFFYKLFCSEFLKNVYFGSHPMVAHTVLDTTIIFIYTFFDFAGYTNIAIGVGRILGIHTPINFQTPFVARSVSEFYNRWHISLGDWVKRNIYFPMQMSYVRGRQVSSQSLLLFNLFVLICSFFFIGIWHGLKVRFVLWGVMLGVTIALEKVVGDFLKKRGFDKSKSLGKIWTWVGPIYNIVMISLIIHPAMNLMLGL